MIDLDKEWGDESQTRDLVDEAWGDDITSTKPATTQLQEDTFISNVGRD